MYILSPSVLAANFNELGEQIREVKEAGATWTSSSRKTISCA